jgi:hypothetical protein
LAGQPVNSVRNNVTDPIDPIDDPHAPPSDAPAVPNST